MPGSFATDGFSARRPSDRRTDAAARPEDPSSRLSFAFRADLDAAELDQRGRPTNPWSAKAVELSRSHIAFRSRRMCYRDRELLLAIHLIDDRPVALFGIVERSDYDGDGLYKTIMSLAPLPETEGVRAWLASLSPRG